MTHSAINNAAIDNCGIASTFAPPSVQAPLRFLQLAADERKLQVFMPTPDDPNTRRTNTFSDQVVTIADSCAPSDGFSLDVEGFELYLAPSVVTDFFDDQQVRVTYYAESEALLKRVTGASAVYFFEHTIRIEDGDARTRDAKREPVAYVHNDYTALSGSQRLQDLLTPAAAREWAKHRFAIINVWRSIAGPVVTTPLAFCGCAKLG